MPRFYLPIRNKPNEGVGEADGKENHEKADERPLKLLHFLREKLMLDLLKADTRFCFSFPHGETPPSKQLFSIIAREKRKINQYSEKRG